MITQALQPQFTGGYPQQYPQQGTAAPPLQPQYTAAPPQMYPQQQGYPPGTFPSQQQPYMPPQQQYMPPQPYPQQAVGAPRQFHSAVPLAALGQASSPVDCPVCHQRTMTRTSRSIGNTTQFVPRPFVERRQRLTRLRSAWALGCCICFCLPCIPYLIPATWDTNHRCGGCGVLLATWHRSGRTVAHQHG